MTPKEANQDLLDRLAIRYPREKAWCIFHEVPNSSWGGTRRADALVLNCSNGCEALEGFEVKVTRADWLTELRDPKKAKQGLQPYVHRWWLLTLKDLAKPEELPDGWGMLIPHGKSLKAAVQARPVAEPKPLSPYVCALLIRRMWDEQKYKFESAVQARARELQGTLSEQRIREIERAAIEEHEGELKMYRDALDQVNRVLGIRFTPEEGKGRWRRGELDFAGLSAWEAAPLVRSIFGEDRAQHVEYARQAIERARETVTRQLKNLEDTLTRLELVEHRIGAPSTGKEVERGPGATEAGPGA